ncbi:MAG: hypothetical protein MJZ37_08480 [Bacilli bacterium]|nr:hypothetical protein [Bacilli bacterium]
MIIYLANVSDPPDKITKTVNYIEEEGIDAKLIHPCDVLAPNFTIDYTQNRSLCNYCYIPSLGRYYYVTCSLDTAKRLHVSCTVDPLMSWANSIKQCNATIIRKENGSPTIIPDSKLPIQPGKKSIAAIHGSSGFFNTNLTQSYLLTVIGGEGTNGS